MKKIICFLITHLFFISCSNMSFQLFNTKQNVLFSNTQKDYQQSSDSYILYLDENLVPKKTNVSDSSAFSIPLIKNRYTPVLFYNSVIDEKPIGCIYPLSTYLSEHGGFSAWIYYRIAVSSKEDKKDIYAFLSLFNWSRFQTYIIKYNDPWVLNQTLIKESITDKTFNAYSIKEVN